jgi:Tfp pilus assembly protein PilO
MKQKNLMVGALVAAFVLVLWYMMLFSPTGSKASKANKATAEAQTKVKTLQAEIRKIAPAQSGSQKELEAKLQTAIPKTPAEAEFLRQLDSIKAATGVEFQSVSPGAPVTAGGLSTISVSIVVKGSVAQVMSYLGRLEKLQRLFVTDNVGVTAAGSTSNAGATPSGGPVGNVFAGMGAPPALQVQITGRVFTQAVVAAAGATATGVTPTASATAGK